MKITAYMNLQPKHIHLDLESGTVRLDGSARTEWNAGINPSAEAAAASLNNDCATYTVTAELPDGSIFTVRGAIDQTEGRGGSYVAGVFDNFPAAYEAAKGLGVQGSPGGITVRPAPVNVFSTVEAWKAAVNLNAARKAKTVDAMTLGSIVELAADDARALGAADPEFAIWEKGPRSVHPPPGARTQLQARIPSWPLTCSPTTSCSSPGTSSPGCGNSLSASVTAMARTPPF